MQKGESCPGEEECSDPESENKGPLAKYQDADIATTCGGCSLKGSKPESTPDALVPYVAMAVNLSEVESIGGRFTYPDGLTAVEWEALKALNRGRSQAERLRQKRDEKKK